MPSVGWFTRCLLRADNVQQGAAVVISAFATNYMIIICIIFMVNSRVFRRLALGRDAYSYRVTFWS